MAGHQDHQHWVRVGLRQHEARRYSKALVLFRKAQRMAPECPVTAYNCANTLHMLDRDDEAAPILQALIGVDPDILDQRCSGVGGRSLQLDALYLLFLVSVHGQGCSAKAFHYAEEHLRRRRRGLRSAWSLREVRAEIAALRREWEGAG